VLASPLLHAEMEVPCSADRPPELAALPAGPGVLVVEDQGGRVIQLTATANVRRLVRRRLAPGAPETGRIDRTLARRIRAATTGSAFESDWAYLRLAREAAPQTYRLLLDRWRGWFIHCDPEAPHPRLTKTGEPTAPGVHLGPVGDKHAAQRLLEALEAGFDLCRYHHLLIQAPNAVACAYKEMGRCPAPCDGSVGMDDYRGLVREALAFAARGPAAGLEALERSMHEAAASRDFEGAARLRRRWRDLEAVAAPAYRHVRTVDGFAFLAVLTCERPDHARLFLCLPSAVEPFVDVDPSALTPATTRELIEAARAAAVRAEPRPPTRDAIALTCRHLFAPRRARTETVLLPVHDPELTPALRRRMRAAARRVASADAIEERDLDAEALSARGDPPDRDDGGGS
jgi:SAM-dependent methyltransferase